MLFLSDTEEGTQSIWKTIQNTINSISPIFLILGFLVVIALLLLFFLRPKKNATTRDITFAASAIAMSFVLSYVKVSPGVNGGSVTLASCIPLMVYCYVYGFRKGLFAAFIYSVLQIIQEPYIVHPVQILLDYILPFSAMGLVSMFKFLQKPLKGYDICLSLTVVYGIRFTCHVITGYYHWGTPWVGSMTYNLGYLGPDFALAMIVTVILVSTGSLALLTRILKAGQNKVSKPGFPEAEQSSAPMQNDDETL